jgi:hypothetical protein
MADAIEVFRDLTLYGPIGRRPELRAALIAEAKAPWLPDLERAAEAARNGLIAEDVLLFQRGGDADLPPAGLTLLANDDGYYVPNIVPLEVGSLTYAQYNAILADFIASVAEPIVAIYGYEIKTTEPRQTLDDWLSNDAVVKLRSFSGATNKSTGASHPMDERRWFDFIVAVHRAGKKLDADRLARWLHEADGWDEDSAHRLAGNYEKSLALLQYYDEN